MIYIFKKIKYCSNVKSSIDISTNDLMFNIRKLDFEDNLNITDEELRYIPNIYMLNLKSNINITDDGLAR